FAHHDRSTGRSFSTSSISHTRDELAEASSEFPSRNEETIKVVSRQFAIFRVVQSRLDLSACRVTCLLLDPMELHGQTKGLGQLGEPIQIVRFQRDAAG